MLLCNYPNPPATLRVKLKLKHLDLADLDVLISIFFNLYFLIVATVPLCCGLQEALPVWTRDHGESRHILLASQFLEEPQTTPFKIRAWAGCGGICL